MSDFFGVDYRGRPIKEMEPPDSGDLIAMSWWNLMIGFDIVNWIKGNEDKIYLMRRLAVHFKAYGIDSTLSDLIWWFQRFISHELFTTSEKLKKKVRHTRHVRARWLFDLIINLSDGLAVGWKITKNQYGVYDLMIFEKKVII